MEQGETKQQIKDRYHNDFDIALEMVLENPNIINKKKVSSIDIIEFYLKTSKITEKWVEIYNRHSGHPGISDIDCQIHYSFLLNGTAI